MTRIFTPLMCKSYIVIALLFVGSNAFSQEQKVEDDFEGNGTILTWYGDDCGLELNEGNPYKTGINTSSSALKYVDQGGSYANIRFDIPFQFNIADDAVFSLKIYVASSDVTGSQNNQVSLKLQNGGIGEPWTSQTEIIKSIELDKWQELSFDFENDAFVKYDPSAADPIDRNDYNRILIQINGENNNDLVTAYIDDFAYAGTIGWDANPKNYGFDQLIWADEFSEDGAIDSDKWFHQTELPDGKSWYNNELQHYTNRIENSFVDDGNLNLVAIRESFTDQNETKDFTSARLNSKFAFTYGRVEVRAKLPMGRGTWPAIWMLGKNIQEPGAYWVDDFGTTPWPACGEIDIMEHWGVNQNYVQSAMHTPSSNGNTINKGGFPSNNVSDLFHIYELVWTEDSMIFSMDGNVFYVYAPLDKNDDTWPFYEDQYLLLNTAINSDIDPSFTESPMVIDYVRVYQKDLPDAIRETGKLKGFNVYPNPANDLLQIDIAESFVSGNLEIINEIGQQVFFQENLNDKISINLSSYAKGTYLIKLNNKNEQLIKSVIKD